jgi:hypothetical protein
MYKTIHKYVPQISFSPAQTKIVGLASFLGKHILKITLLKAFINVSIQFSE